MATSNVPGREPGPRVIAEGTFRPARQPAEQWEPARIEVPIPEIDGDQCDPARFRRVATLLYTMMATGMTEDEAIRRLRGYGPRFYSSEGA